MSDRRPVRRRAMAVALALLSGTFNPVAVYAEAPDSRALPELLCDEADALEAMSVRLEAAKNSRHPLFDIFPRPFPDAKIDRAWFERPDHFAARAAASALYGMVYDLHMEAEELLFSPCESTPTLGLAHRYLELVREADKDTRTLLELLCDEADAMEAMSYRLWNARNLRIPFFDIFPRPLPGARINRAWLDSVTFSPRGYFSGRVSVSLLRLANELRTAALQRSLSPCESATETAP